jgi:hypothetical protein
MPRCVPVARESQAVASLAAIFLRVSAWPCQVA